MTNRIEDGWHLFLGVRVWVEKNRVKYADAGKYGFGYLYRRVNCQWVQIESVSVATFYTGMKLGYITVLMDERCAAYEKDENA